MATAAIVLIEISMTLVETCLYDGEHILARFPVRGFMQERELAATGSRVIFAGPGRFCDVTCAGLSSLSCGSSYEPAWAFTAFAFTALTIAFARAAAIVPGNLSFGPFSVGLGWLSSLVGFPAVLCGAIALVAAVIFLFTARMGITLQSPGSRLFFSYGRARHDDAMAFVKAVRATCK